MITFGENHLAAIELLDVETHVPVVIFDEEATGQIVAHCGTDTIHRHIGDVEAVALLTCQSVEGKGSMLVFEEDMSYVDIRLEIHEEVARRSDAVGRLNRCDLPSSEAVTDFGAGIAGRGEKEEQKESKNGV